DCLSFSVMYVGTNVIDTDNDGLLDIWETAVSGQTGGFRDPATGNLLFDLNALGANPMHKDLFVEADFMREFTANPLNPNDPNGPKSTPHSHDLLLKTDVVDLIGDAFKNAPVPNPNSDNPNLGDYGISLHMDLGEYHGPDPYIIKGSPTSVPPTEGGDVIDERWPFFYCTSGASCVFPNQPGVIYWALG